MMWELECSKQFNVNLYGSLSNIMLNKNCAYDMECQHIYKSKKINRLNMLFQILEAQKIFYMKRSLVRTKLSAKCDETDENNEYKELESSVNSKQSNEASALSEKNIKKMQSLIAVACKAIRVFYAILTKGEDYDSERMLRDIKRPEIYM